MRGRKRGRKPKQEYWYATFEVSDPYQTVVYTRIPVEMFTAEQTEEIEDYARKYILDKYSIVTDDCLDIGDQPYETISVDDEGEEYWDDLGEFLE